jgi:hypothetical protein
MQDDCDHRPTLATADGAGLHVTAIRMRRPGTADGGTPG